MGDHLQLYIQYPSVLSTCVSSYVCIKKKISDTCQGELAISVNFKYLKTCLKT